MFVLNVSNQLVSINDLRGHENKTYFITSNLHLPLCLAKGDFLQSLHQVTSEIQNYRVKSMSPLTQFMTDYEHICRPAWITVMGFQWCGILHGMNTTADGFIWIHIYTFRNRMCVQMGSAWLTLHPIDLLWLRTPISIFLRHIKLLLMNIYYIFFVLGTSFLHRSQCMESRSWSWSCVLSRYH